MTTEEALQLKPGDRVRIVESRPDSRTGRNTPLFAKGRIYVVAKVDQDTGRIETTRLNLSVIDALYPSGQRAVWLPPEMVQRVAGAI